MPRSTTARPPSEPLPILLANTISIDRSGDVRDAFDNLTGIQSWVATAGAASALYPPQSGGDVATAASAGRLIRLRDAVRRMAAEQTRDPRPVGQSPVGDVEAARRIVNKSSALSVVWPQLEYQASSSSSIDVWSRGSFTDALTTLIARRTIELITSVQWDQLQPCLAPSCAYFFLRDATRRQWCSAACGNRARVARHAMRQRSPHAVRD